MLRERKDSEVTMKKGYIVLATGQVFEGKRFGAEKDAIGELVFTTGMCGYIETMTDPSFFGQLVIHTFPLIGNYGMIAEDAESRGCFLNGYIVREWCQHPSNFRAEGDIDAYLKEAGIPGIYGVDTRELTKIVREEGAIPAKIVSEVTDAVFEELKGFRIKDAVKSVSVAEKEFYPAVGEKEFSVTMIDYGYKKSIAKELQERGCDVTVVPHDTSAEEIMATEPDGIMLSNGPGDPEENGYAIAQLQKLMGKKPMFGICLGHQILALANGGRSQKLKYGHRGANQPVKDLSTGRVYITSQNHGYTILPESLYNGVLRYANANDGTCEGIDYPEHNSFSVQFHPEACGGPKDTRFIFERFIANMRGEADA
jgi:carbamoyl-phosphate synthase small subunit